MQYIAEDGTTTTLGLNRDGYLETSICTGPLVDGGAVGLLGAWKGVVDEAGRTTQSSQINKRENNGGGQVYHPISLAPGWDQQVDFGDPSFAPYFTGPCESSTSVTRYLPDGSMSQHQDSHGKLSFRAQDSCGRFYTAVDPENNISNFQFNGNNMPIRVTRTEQGPSFTQTFVTEIFYDSLNRVIAVSDLGATTSSGQIDAGHRETGNTRRFIYDSRNKLVSYTDANGPVNSAAIADLDPGSEHSSLPAGFPNPTLNDPGNKTEYEYDNLGRLLNVKQQMTSTGIGGGSSSGTLTTKTRWDANSRLISRTDPNNNVTSYQYDYMDRVVLETYADSNTVQYQYDRMSNVRSMRDQNGTLFLYQPDIRGRIVKETVVNPPSGGLSEYQTTFCLSSYDGLNRLVSTEDNDSKVSFKYDVLGTLVRETAILGSRSRQSPSQVLQGEIYSTHHEFDAEGFERGLTYPTGETLHMDWDGLNRPTSIYESGSSSDIATFSYVGNRRYQDDYENGTTITRKYDGSKRIVQIDQKKGSVYLTGFKYGHDREGHRRFEQKLDSTGTAITGTTYGYDSAYRLINANTSVSATDLASIAFNTPGVPSVPGTPEKQYAYDAAGNRTQTILDSVTTNYTSTGDDADRNQYSDIGGLTQVHDANGNLVDDDSLGFEFSAHDQLVVINDGSDQTRYRYDALGRRFSKEVEVGATTTTVLYKYSGHQVIVEDEYVNGVYNDSKKFVYALGIDEPVRMEHVGSGNLYYYGRNSLGSVTALSDNTGALVEGYEYAPFGQETILNSSGTVISATAFKNPYRFTGRRADYEEGHGLYFYRSRYYRPETGRFAGHDVAGDWYDLGNKGNGQAYCGNDPVNYLDPTGHQGDSSWGAKGGSEKGKSLPPANPWAKVKVDKEGKATNGKQVSRAKDQQSEKRTRILLTPEVVKKMIDDQAGTGYISKFSNSKKVTERVGVVFYDSKGKIRAVSVPGTYQHQSRVFMVNPKKDFKSALAAAKKKYGTVKLIATYHTHPDAGWKTFVGRDRLGGEVWSSSVFGVSKADINFFKHNWKSGDPSGISDLHFVIQKSQWTKTVSLFMLEAKITRKGPSFELHGLSFLSSLYSNWLTSWDLERILDIAKKGKNKRKRLKEFLFPPLSGTN